MKQYENLMLTAMEECDELSQALSKAMRFGLDGSHCETKESNNYSIVKEFIHLKIVMDMLFDQRILEPVSSTVAAVIENDKIEKVLKYQEVSKNLGLIDPE